jgi:predicted glycogen debranching enzyme
MANRSPMESRQREPAPGPHLRGSELRDLANEWLEADGLGGYASGTACGLRTRRYHGLLCPALDPPVKRHLLVADVEAWVDVGRGPRALSAHRYDPDVTHPDGLERLASFRPRPLPTWRWKLEDEIQVVRELFVPRGSSRVALRWWVEGAEHGALFLIPLLALRDVHALRREDTGLSLDAAVDGEHVRWRPDPTLPTVLARSNGRFRPQPTWYKNFLYEEERRRGYDCVEDLASPGLFEHDLGQGPAELVLGLEELASEAGTARDLVARLRERELERRAGRTVLDLSSDDYLVRRGDGLTVVAGYPWFTDWGRDTFLSLRGLLLARDRVDDALGLLLAWASHVSQGMLPNRFPDHGETPDYNSVDASLWFVVAVAETLAQAPMVPPETRAALDDAVTAILDGYARGTRFGIHADRDGLLACGVPGLQLTWMDAKVEGEVMTPRVGKPVEIQALWIAALTHGANLDARHGDLRDRARAAFAKRFWNARRGWLNDVVDCDHRPGIVDDALRPNQLLAVGGLPGTLLDGRQARAVVDAVERELWTPLGIRTLSPRDPHYRGRYEGGPLERDRAYHQGTAWPWLLGPFVEAWLRVRDHSPAARNEARERFLAPLHEHLDRVGLGHVSEVVDGDPPHHPGGCPFQAWSLAEFAHLDRLCTDRSVAV